MLLEKFALPRFDEKAIQEIDCCKMCYQAVDKVEDSLFNKEQKKKKAISMAFEVLVGLFDLGYDLKIKYSLATLDDDCINIEDLNKSFDEIFYQIYFQCFERYLAKMHTFTNNRISQDAYKFAKIICLNKDNILIKKLADNIYLELLDCNISLQTDMKPQIITDNELRNLKNKEILRFTKIINNIDKKKVFSRLSNEEIKEVFACFCEYIFTKLQDTQKVRLAVLLYNYFTDDDRVNNTKKYLRKTKDISTNEDYLRMVIDDLLISGRTMIVKKKNIDMVNDVLSGLPIIYSSEIDKENIGKLDSLKNIINEIKR